MNEDANWKDPPSANQNFKNKLNKATTVNKYGVINNLLTISQYDEHKT